MNTASIKSPRIGLCSTNLLSIGSEINSSARGCQSDKGLGAGVKFEGCAGSGASHGGNGGPGAKLNEASKCD